MPAAMTTRAVILARLDAHAACTDEAALGDAQAAAADTGV